MMKFYFLVKFIVEMTHLSMKFSHIWINIENFPWKLGLIRSVFFLNFSRPREQTFSVKNHTELLNSIWFVFLSIGFSSFDLIITRWSADWYWETYLYTHFKLILSIEKCNDWHVNQTVRSYALNAIYMCLGLFSPYHVRKIIDLSHFWPFKTGFPDSPQYFWLYISQNSCSDTHLTTQSHHGHSNHPNPMRLRIRTIFLPPDRFSFHILSQCS